jgi:hypothetical protein
MAGTAPQAGAFCTDSGNRLFAHIAQSPWHGPLPATFAPWLTGIYRVRGTMEERMEFGMQLLARFGLYNRKTEAAPDAFDLRLQRIGTRERRLSVRRSLFRSKPAPSAA